MDADHYEQQLELVNGVLSTFYEWRHKIMVRFGVVTAALSVGAYQVRFGPNWLIWLICLAGTGTGVAALLLDRINSGMIGLALDVGAATEEQLQIPDAAGVMSKLKASRCCLVNGHRRAQSSSDATVSAPR